MRALLAKLLEMGAKKIKPTTLIEKGKKIGIDVDKLKTGDTKLVNKVLKELGFKPKSGFGSKIIKTGTAAGAGGAATLGAQKFAGDVKEEMEKSRMAGGGMVKKRAKSKKSKGAGAAIRGTKFKGVF
jgi:hypothetical protein